LRERHSRAHRGSIRHNISSLSWSVPAIAHRAAGRISCRILSLWPFRHSRPGPGLVNRDSAPWRAWRWGVQSDVGELLPFLQDSASGEIAPFRVLMARELVFPRGGFPIRVFVAEKLVALHPTNSRHPPCYGWPACSFQRRGCE